MAVGSMLLISTNTETCPSPVYPVALGRLAGALAQAGHTVRQYDVLVHGLERLPQMLAESRPDLVGISLRNIDNIDSSSSRFYLDGCRQMVTAVRARTAAPIVIGGSGFSLFPARILEDTGADYGVAGPGERALCALLEAVRAGKTPTGIPGLLRRGIAAPLAPPAGPVFTRPLHDPEIIRYYSDNGSMIGLQTKRGCPRNCIYCTYPQLDGNGITWADPVELVDEVERLVKDYQVRYFFAADSVFNLDRARELAFAEEICRRGIRISWGAFFLPAGLDRPYLSTLRRSGLRHVEFGTDSLSDTVLRVYEKDFTVADVLEASALTQEARLQRAHYLILGGPGETPDTLRETMRNAEKITQSVFFPFAGLRIYPGTPLHDRAVREGMLAPGHDCLEPVFYFAPGLTPEAIWEAVGNGTGQGNAWVLPWNYGKLLSALERIRQRGFKGPLWEYARFDAKNLPIAESAG